MKQLIQSFKNGETILLDVPLPNNPKGNLLIQTTYSLVSLGTEKMLINFGKSSLLSKAKQQPEKVKQVIDKIKTDGIKSTIETVLNKLDEPIPLGYSNVGVVVEVGENVEGFKIGDRVVSNGSHSEYVSIPKNLCAKVPDSVDDKDAVFTVIASIGLQGIRLLKPSFGEVVVVYGMGLIGILTAQILKNSGCIVVGVDIDSSKLELAKQHGIKVFNPNKDGQLEFFINDLTSFNGADGVIITASSKSNEIISESAKITKKRGKVVLIGVVGLDINRSDFYEKEITFQVSCSYGPGRYDPIYEDKGIDYPYGYVRWTENRNFQAILSALNNKVLEVQHLISQIEKIEDYDKIYNDITKSGNIASIIEYPNGRNFSIIEDKKVLTISPDSIKKDLKIGLIGSGNYTKMTLLPNLSKAKAQIKYIASQNGLSGTLLAKKYNIQYSTTDYTQILKDQNINLVFITTRHSSHSFFIEECLKNNKDVFVEKPLAINKDQLLSILKTRETFVKNVFIGFNRRFSLHSIKVKEKLSLNPLSINITVNAGFIPKNSWVQDMQIGGGRIIGEACHFIDLIQFFTRSRITSVSMFAQGINATSSTDIASIHLKLENGSLGIINYFSSGSKAYPKERIEIFQDQKTFVIDNFRKTTGYGTKLRLRTNIDKGHKNMLKSLFQGEVNLFPDFESIVNTTEASFAAIDSLKSNGWISI